MARCRLCFRAWWQHQWYVCMSVMLTALLTLWCSAQIAVPTSVGYGAAFQGVAPMLTALNSCSPGVTVVNIDNGVGAAVTAARMLAVVQRRYRILQEATDANQ